MTEDEGLSLATFWFCKWHHHLPSYQCLFSGSHPCCHHAPHCSYPGCQQTLFTPLSVSNPLTLPYLLNHHPAQVAIFLLKFNSHLASILISASPVHSPHRTLGRLLKIDPPQIILLLKELSNKIQTPVPYKGGLALLSSLLSKPSPLPVMWWLVGYYLFLWLRVQIHATPTCNTIAYYFCWGLLSLLSDLSLNVCHLSRQISLPPTLL